MVDLRDGVLTAMAAMDPPRAASLTLVIEALERLLPQGWHLRSQLPITLSNSEPEPDVAVVRGAIRDYSSRHPSGFDIGLLVEVSDTSIRLDRDQKLRIYADAGVPVYWIVNLVENTVEVDGEPVSANGDRPAEYRTRETLGSNDSVAVTLDDTVVGELNVAELLP